MPHSLPHQRRTRRRTLVAMLLPLLAACGAGTPDAYGNFEADEVVVSAETGGRLLRFAAEEGERLAAGAVVGQVDTTGLALKRDEILQQQRASTTRNSEARAQVDVLLAQLQTARSELARTRRLYDAEAATARQLDQAQGEVRVLEERIRAARAQSSVVREESGGAEARVRQIDEQLDRSRITNPVAGTVLTTYVEPGEYVQPGAPLYAVADLDTLTFRAWVSGAQLPRLRLGQQVRVRVDSAAGGLRTLPGIVVWIASEAEFTPTPIQTRDERVEQVYAVRVRVPDTQGVLKVGMPGELVLDGVPPDSVPRTASAVRTGSPRGRP